MKAKTIETKKVEPLKLRRACKLMRANLAPEMERKLARECGLPVAELRRRADADA
jgi:hypothetical protein